MKILGYRIGPLAYITDANHIESEELLKLKDCRLLVLNALRKQKHFSHFSLPEALQIISTIHPHQAYLTHISHEMGLYAEVESQLPENVHLAYDGLQVTI